jgi:hypothetical protein
MPFLCRLPVTQSGPAFILGDAVSLFVHKSKGILGLHVSPGCLFLRIGKFFFPGLNISASSEPKKQGYRKKDRYQNFHNFLPFILELCRFYPENT